jgi:hypothetical protein
MIPRSAGRNQRQRDNRDVVLLPKGLRGFGDILCRLGRNLRGAVEAEEFAFRVLASTPAL